ncbi:hypothetical protein L6R52_00845 [Myxococcota bacterium]|nr:hypothetical protein [Myxococcota bacterium]
MRAGPRILASLLASCAAACVADTGALAPRDVDAGREVAARCGDGVVDEGELCDGADLGGTTCADFGFTGGALACNARCAGFFVAACTGIPTWAEDREDPCARCAVGELCLDDVCTPTCDASPLPEDVGTLDVHTVRVSGQLVGPSGPIVLGEGERFGRVELVELGTGSTYSVAVDTSGAYAAEVFAGTYAIAHGGSRSATLGTQATWLTRSIDLFASRTLDLALPARVRASVRLTVDGAPPQVPAELTFRALDAADGASFQSWSPSVVIDAGASAAAPILLYPGRYEVTLEAPGLVSLETRRPGFVIASDVEVFEGSALAFDHTTGALRVEATAAGRPVPTAAMELSVIDGETGREVFPAASGRFVATVHGGRYRVTARVGLREPWGWFGRVITRDVDVRGEVVIPVELEPRSTVEGHVRSAAHADRPMELHLADAAAGTSAVIHVPAGAVTPLSARLLPGRYALAAFVEGGVGVGVEPPTLVVEGDTRAELVVASPPRVELRGRVTVMGARMRDNTRSDRSRARVRFTCLEGCGRFYEDVDLGVRGEADYAITLPRGVYAVRLLPAPPTDWELPSPQDAVPPYDDYLLRPRLVVDGDAVRDFDVVVRTVSGEVRSNGRVLDAESLPGPWEQPAVSVGLVRRIDSDVPEVPARTTSGPARFRFEAFPGRYRLVVWRVGASSFFEWGGYRAVTVDQDVVQELDVELRPVRGTLTFDGASWPADLVWPRIWARGGGSFTEVVPDAAGHFEALVPRVATSLSFSRYWNRALHGTAEQRLVDGCLPGD